MAPIDTSAKSRVTALLEREGLPIGDFGGGTAGYYVTVNDVEQWPERDAGGVAIHYRTNTAKFEQPTVDGTFESIRKVERILTRIGAKSYTFQRADLTPSRRYFALWLPPASIDAWNRALDERDARLKASETASRAPMALSARIAESIAWWEAQELTRQASTSAELLVDRLRNDLDAMRGTPVYRDVRALRDAINYWEDSRTTLLAWRLSKFFSALMKAQMLGELFADGR